MSQYSESWCERYCSDTVRALRDEMWDLDGDFGHELDYPDENNPGIEPTISHEVCWLNPATKVDRFWWSQPKGWTYVLHGDRTEHSMQIAIDENPSAFAAAAREVCLRHQGGSK